MPSTRPLSEKELDLVSAAFRATELELDRRRHRVLSAWLTEEGNVFYGVNLEMARIKRASVCAEPAAVARIVLAEETPVLAVAVRIPKPGEGSAGRRVVNPCGVCREMYADYYPDLDVIVAESGEPVVCRSGDLLPFEYRSSSS